MSNNIVVFHEWKESWFYVGDLDRAREYAYGEGIVDSAGRDAGDNFVVRLGDGNAVGKHPNAVEAWRYALGALFGPVDEHYSDKYVRLLLDTFDVPGAMPVLGLLLENCGTPDDTYSLSASTRIAVLEGVLDAIVKAHRA